MARCRSTHYACDCQIERMAEMEKALRFYADRWIYYETLDGVGSVLSSKVLKDMGATARAALGIRDPLNVDTDDEEGGE